MRSLYPKFWFCVSFCCNEASNGADGACQADCNDHDAIMKMISCGMNSKEIILKEKKRKRAYKCFIFLGYSILYTNFSAKHSGLDVKM